MIHFKKGVLTILLMLSWSHHANADEAEYASVLIQIKQCAVCHGENGATLQPAIPILSGQHFYYLYVQLKDFKSGLRKNEIMGPIASQLEKPQMKSLAKYFSEQDWPNLGYRADSATEIRGETATGAGQCVQCHLGGYEGDSRIPRLAGQHPEYLLSTMTDFKYKKRLNSAAKSSLLVSYDDEDIKAMSEYLAGK
ncbi:MAG: cytochrome c [Gammaproteobacteria bacterium]